MANLFKSIKPTAHLSKSGFDLSQKHVFSSKAGQALPCLFVETVPGDHFTINCQSLHRSMTMNTAAFLRGKFRYDFFFVPYSQLWHPFNQFITQRKDIHTTLQKGTNFVPVVDLGKLLEFVIGVRKVEIASQRFSYTGDIFGGHFCQNCVRLLDLAGYGNFMPIIDFLYAYGDDGVPSPNYEDAERIAKQFEGKYVNLFRIAAYQHIWYDYYRNKYYDEDIEFGDINMNYVSAFNFDDLSCETFGDSVLPVPTVIDAQSLNKPEAVRILNIFQMRYVQWKKDIFTSALPGTQFGSVSTVQIGFGNDFQIGISGTGHVISSSDDGRWQKRDGGNMTAGSELRSGTISLYETADGSVISHNHSVSVSDIASRLGVEYQNFNSSFDVLAYERAKALQAWKQNTLRAGNMTDSNFLAHYGVEPRYDSDENVAFLGSYEAILQINSVVAQADTGGSVNGSVGDLAGTGTAVLKGDAINYDSKDFGVIVCMSSFVPESEYNSVMIDKANRLHEQFDFFTPEYQDIGLEALSGVDFNALMFANEPNKVIGYVPRYAMYKQAIDKVHGEFATVTYQKSDFAPISAKGTLVPWVAPRLEQLVAVGTSDVGYSEFERGIGTWYVNPRVLDNIIGISANSSQDTDYFLNNVYFDIKAVRPMSVLGLPNF